MTSRYWYSLVRCVPEPRTGEFINIGAIAGAEEQGDWAIRQVGSERRAIKLAGSEALTAVHGFMARAQETIDTQEMLVDEDLDAGLLTNDWLQDLYRNHRNVVQLAAPAPVLASSAEDALDLVFDRMIVDPVSQPRGYVTKSAVVSRIRSAYRMTEDLPDYAVTQKSDLFVGDNIHTTVDFAVANGSAVQLTQAWSFQRGEVDGVSTQVKAWAYAMQRVRDGEGARVGLGRFSAIPAGVDLAVVIAPPQTRAQTDAFDEALEVFSRLGAQVTDVENSIQVADRAAQLWRAKYH